MVQRARAALVSSLADYFNVDGDQVTMNVMQDVVTHNNKKISYNSNY